MSRESKRLRKAFEIEVSESKMRGLTSRARERLVEGATRRLERGIDAETAQRVRDAEDRAARILEKREKDAEKKAKKQEAERERREREQARKQHQARCTCRNPRLDRSGKCTRCKNFPAGRR
jgi:hypothetical protein